MVTAIALYVLAGIVPAENDNLNINVDIAQNVTDIMGVTYENSIETASFGITIPQNKELLKMSEKKRICRPHERDNDIPFPPTNQNKNGLKVALFVKNTTEKTSIIIHTSKNKNKNIEIMKSNQNEVDVENHGIKEKIMAVTGPIMTEEPKLKSEYKAPETDNFTLTPPHPITGFSVEEPSSDLTITILNETTASVKWTIYTPGEYAAYVPFEKKRLEDEVEAVEKGMEDLFLQDVEAIKIVEGDDKTLFISFNLKRDCVDCFVTGNCRYTYELATYAPIRLDVLKINIPKNKTLLSINPGPNEIEGNELVYHNYNWIYPIEIDYGDKDIYRTSVTTIGEVWERSTPAVISIDTFGTNNHSRFCIPDNWVGGGSDPVPGTGYNALQVAEIYNPRLCLWSSLVDQCPDAVYYRVVKGYDPYAEFDAYLIQYFVYWDCQFCVPGHDYDYEPIFIWVRNIGERPYRVAYDLHGGLNLHAHEIHRTYLWSSCSDTYYDMPSDVYMQHKAYYPFGRSEYDQDYGNDIYLWNISTSLQNNWDGNHVKLGIANCWHTFDTDITGSNCSNYTLSPLTDDELIAAYRLELDGANSIWCPGGVEAFKYYISDPFHGVF